MTEIKIFAGAAMESNTRRQGWKRYFPLSLHGWLIYLVSMGLASLFCVLLRQVSTSDVHVPLIFILVVLLVSLLTEGYFYGLLAALSSVFTVNVAFTYPYMKMDFSAYGYPLTFLTMTAVGLAVSTLTTRVKAQEQLRRESEHEKLRANLMRAVSHDLRTPLTSISGAIGAVLEGGLEPGQQRELLEDARRDADWLCRMVENLLSVTRIESDSASALHKQEEALEEVLGAAVLAFRKRNPSVDVTVSVPEQALFVPMDAVLIQQVLQNLLDNAVLHGGTTTAVRISAQRESGQAAVCVEDNGEGIDRRQLDHLFDGGPRFSGTSSPDTARGLGIGLPVCRAIVEAHGGIICARNRPEGGAAFTFTLPTGETDYDDT